MKVILSVKPEFVQKIIKGQKKFEYRRKIFQKEVESIIVYASSPWKKVVGEIIIDDIIHDDLSTLWKKTKKYSGVDKKFFEKYFHGSDIGYAIKIKKFILYQKEKKLSDFKLNNPPQSFAYYKN